MSERDVLFEALAALLRSIVVEAVQDAVSELEPQPRPALLNRQQLGRELGCSAPTITRLMRDGMPHVVLGTVPRYELDAVLRWLRERAARGQMG
jgi:hypothetical protein